MEGLEGSRGVWRDVEGLEGCGGVWRGVEGCGEVWRGVEGCGEECMLRVPFQEDCLEIQLA